MKRLAKTLLLTAVAVMGLTGREARGAAFPSVINLYVPFSQFQGERSAAVRTATTDSFGTIMLQRNYF
jgi:hypothetical protein